MNSHTSTAASETAPISYPCEVVDCGATAVATVIPGRHCSGGEHAACEHHAEDARRRGIRVVTIDDDSVAWEPRTATSPATALSDLTFDVLFLSPITGRWKLQHSFLSREYALTCGENLSALHSTLVFRVVRQGKRVVAEEQIASFNRQEVA